MRFLRAAAPVVAIVVVLWAELMALIYTSKVVLDTLKSLSVPSLLAQVAAALVLCIWPATLYLITRLYFNKACEEGRQR